MISTTSTVITAGAGGLIGGISNTQIQYCYAKMNIKSESIAGGLIGNAAGTTTSKINECYSMGEVEGKTYVGGIIGYGSAEISDCFAISIVKSVTNSTYTGGIAGYMPTTKIKNCYAAGKVSQGGSGVVLPSNPAMLVNSYYDSLTTGIIPKNDRNIGKLTSALIKKECFIEWDFENIWEIKEDKSYPYLKSLGEPDWNPIDMNLIPRGAGTNTDPYLIKNATQLGYLRYDINGVYQIISDIDLNGGILYPAGTSTCPFAGTLDGDGNSIKNIVLKDVEGKRGLFGAASKSEFRNLRIEGVEIKEVSDTSYAGALGSILTDCIIDNICVDGVTVSGGLYGGGLIGSATRGSICRCSVRGQIQVSAIGAAGGLIADATETAISQCLVSGVGTVSGGKDMGVGGLLGSMSNGITAGCYSSIEVKGNNYVGGLVGKVQTGKGQIKECYATGDVAGKGYLGGLAGYLYGSLSDSFAQGSVKSSITNAYVGEIAGYVVLSSINNCYGACHISTGGSGLAYVANGVTISNSYFDSTLSGFTTPVAQARTTEQMQQKATFSGWDFETLWKKSEESYPLLKNCKDIYYQNPLDLQLDQVSHSSLLFHWLDIPDINTYEISYGIQREETKEAKAWIENLLPNTEYQFRVRGKTEHVRGMWSNVLLAKTRNYAVIDGVHVQSMDNVTNCITFTFNPLENVEFYEVLYNQLVEITKSNICTLMYLWPKVTYTVRIRAHMKDGETVISDPVLMRIYKWNSLSGYAKEFVEKSEGQMWFLDEIENLLSFYGKSIELIKSKSDLLGISAIGLANRGVSGKIPIAIGELTSLKYLFLANNELGGEVPEELYALQNLLEVDLSGNHFTNISHL